jgi:mannose-6-phosphate isomerase
MPKTQHIIQVGPFRHLGCLTGADDNHKPEMTIAVTPFSGLCGFRPLDEIAHFLNTVPALQKLVGEGESTAFVSAIAGKASDVAEAAVSSNRTALREVFTKLMESSPAAITTATSELLEETKKGAEFAGGVPEAEALSKLIPVLNGQFPNDIGLFVLFFLNYVTLNPGEAMYLKADDIHAYISGDIIECMASSDNVIRAGFTPKFKDVATLTSSLTYAYASPEEQKLLAAPYAHCTLDAAAYKRGTEVELYDPPIEEFAVIRTAFPAGAPQPANGATSEPKAGKVTFEAIEGPSIVICTSGKGTIAVGSTVMPIKAGYVYFVGATAEVVLEAEGTGEEFVSFRAFCELPTTA